MSQPINQSGNFRGEIIEFGVYAPESGAVSIAVKVRVDECWNAETKAWDDWRSYEVEADGNIWIVSGKEKGNQPLPSGIESLVKFAGWDGNLESVTNGQWTPTPCQFVVNEEAANKYHAEPTYKVSFLNDYNRTPGAGNVTPERAKALQAQYGSQFRALGGNVARNAEAPKTKPKAPTGTAKAKGKTPPPAYPDPNAQLQEAAEEGKDNIPF